MPWFAHCEQRIRNAGFTEQKDVFVNKKLSLVFTIKKDGSVDELKVSKSCGIRSIDEAAMGLIVKAGPYPLDFSPLVDERTVMVAFEYPRLEMNLADKLAPTPQEKPSKSLKN